MASHPGSSDGGRLTVNGRNIGEKLITCPVCQDTFNQPKILPCQHTFCLHCLRDYHENINAERLYRSTSFPCPTCRKATYIPYTGIHDFPDDFKVEQIKDFIQQLQAAPSESIDTPNGTRDTPGEDEATPNRTTDTPTDTTFVPIDKFAQENQEDQCSICLHDNKHTKPVNFCAQCGKYFCKGCTEQHNGNDLLQEHSMLVIQPHGDQNGPLDLSILVCQVHKDDIRYLCEDCDRRLCLVCALTQHSKHKLAHLVSHLDDQRAQLKDKMEVLRSKTSECQQKGEMLAKLKTEAQENYQGLEAQIKSTHGQCVEELNQQRDRMVSHIQHRHSEVMARIDKQVKQLQTQVDRLSELYESAQDMTDPNHAVKLLAGYTSIMDQIDETAGTEEAINHPDIPNTPTFEPCVRISIGELKDDGASDAQDEDAAMRDAETGHETTALCCNASVSHITHSVTLTKPNFSTTTHAPSETKATEKEETKAYLGAEYNNGNSDDLTDESTQDELPESLQTLSDTSFVPLLPHVSSQDPQGGNVLRQNPDFDSKVKSLVEQLRKQYPHAVKVGTDEDSDDDVFLETRPGSLAGSSVDNTSSQPENSSLDYPAIELVHTQGDFTDSKDVTFLSDQRIVATDHCNTGTRLKIYDSFANAQKIISSGVDYIMQPWSVCVNLQTNGIIVTDQGDSTVKILDNQLTLSNVIRRVFNKPSGVGVLATGGYVVTDTGGRHYKASILLPSGMRVRDFAKSGTEKGELMTPNYATVDSHDRILISDCGNHCIKAFDRRGTEILNFTSMTPEGQPLCPQGICVDSQDNILVADQGYMGLSLFSSSGRFIQHITRCDSLPWGLNIHPCGLLGVSTEKALLLYQI